MKTIEDEVNELYNFVVESLDRIEIDKWGGTYQVSIGRCTNKLNFTVDKTKNFLCFMKYNISCIRGEKTNGRYEKYSKTIKKIYQILKKEYAIRKVKKDFTFWQGQIQKVLSYDEKNEEDDFGEPLHTENLPDCSLNVGRTYFVPLKLIAKERLYEGRRGTELYEFQYVNRDQRCYAPIRIAHYHMSKDIQPFEKKNGFIEI